MPKKPLFSGHLSRRSFLGLLGSAGVVSLGGLPVCALADDKKDDPGLGALASENDRQYGAAIQSWQLDDDDFARALKDEVDLLVPQDELKWNVLRPTPASFNFDGYHRIADFARENDLDMRGHVMLWHRSNPPWLEQQLAQCSQSKAQGILREHITRVVAETGELVRNWDVVNEAIEPASGRSDGLRETLWLKALGPDYVPMAYKMMGDADSNLKLTYNEYGLEYDDSYARAKRHALLRLLIDCRKKFAVVNALGLQSHLQCHRPLGGADFVEFLRLVRRLGLEVHVTELDLDISQLHGPLEERIAIAQDYARAYLKLIQGEDNPVDMLVTWGLSDRYSWLKLANRQAAGALPLDAHLKRAPLWDSLRSAWLDA